MNDDALTTPSEGRIRTEVQGPVLQIAIDRAAKRNGFTPAMLQALAEAYTRLDDDPALRVGVLHAEGDHFTAGLDLPSFAPLMQRGERAIAEGLVDPLNLGRPGLRRRTKPMVVAVKGITYTLGIELMLAADIVVAADDCRFSQLEVQRGIMATGGATLRMAANFAVDAAFGVGGGVGRVHAPMLARIFHACSQRRAQRGIAARI